MLTKPVVLVGALLSFAASVFAMPDLSDSGELECNANSGPEVNAGECLGNATPISTPHHNNIINENSCEMDARRGMCVTEEFFGRCSPEQYCLSRPDFGASVLVPVDDSPGDCSDFEKNCEAYAENAQCVINPGYMLTECPKSCYVCFVDGTSSQSKTVEVSIGVRQELPSGATETLKNKFFEVIAETASYMTNEVFAEEGFEEARRDCRNYEPTCAWKVASSGGSYCEDEEEMRICGPACKACDEMIFDDDELYLLKHCEMDERKNIFDNDKSAFSFEDSNTIDAMFRRIVGELPYPTNARGETYPIVPGVNYTYTILSRPSLNPKIHKRIPLSSMNFHIGGPWIVVLDDFLTEEECDRLIELGDLLGRERSTVEEDLDDDDDDDDDDEDDDTESGDTNDNTRNGDNKASEDDEKDKGTTSDDDNETKDWRTSSTAWCDETICMNDPTAMRVEQRIKLTTGVTDTDYYEHLQLLKYNPGQYYMEHHDESGDMHGNKFDPPGPRILTFFLYLNDVEEGGETRFTDIFGDESKIHLDVKPKKGRALLWPSMKNEDLLAFDNRTYHAALEVKKGVKFGANSWMHLRDFRKYNCEDGEIEEMAEKWYYLMNLERIPKIQYH